MARVSTRGPDGPSGVGSHGVRLADPSSRAPARRAGAPARRAELDVHWEHHPAHFWLVLITALVSVALGLSLSERRPALGDARLFLVSLAFLTSAGFLGLHALATPGVLLEGKNAGFVIATPVGLLIAAVFAAPRRPRPDAGGLGGDRRASSAGRSSCCWRPGARYSLAELPPLDRPLTEEARGTALRARGARRRPLYGFAAWRYWRLYPRRASPAARRSSRPPWILLAEAMVAVAFGRNWHASWWEWHVLMAAAFGIVAFTALRERRHRGEAFASLYLDETLGRIDRRYASAVKAAAAEGLDEEELRRRFGLGTDEASVVGRAAEEVRAVETLLTPYLSSQLAARLRDEPEIAALGGGEEREVSVLFADLQGFTEFSERHSPADVLAMLNAYWAMTVPIVLDQHGGMIERFAGDAIMVVFNAAADQPDHAVRAARAGLALQEAAGRVTEGNGDWPRFRVGINTGPAIVGNVGTEEQRSFTAIGDTTNLASRLPDSRGARPGRRWTGDVRGGRSKGRGQADRRSRPEGQVGAGDRIHTDQPPLDSSSHGGCPTHLARPRGVPVRHAGRKAGLPRSVPRQSQVPRGREGAGADRHPRAHARPQRPHRKQRRAGQEAQADGRRRSSSCADWLDGQGGRGRRARGAEQGRYTSTSTASSSR